MQWKTLEPSQTCCVCVTCVKEHALHAANTLGNSRSRCHTELLQVDGKCFCHVVFRAGWDLGLNRLPSVLRWKCYWLVSTLSNTKHRVLPWNAHEHTSWHRHIHNENGAGGTECVNLQWGRSKWLLSEYSTEPFLVWNIEFSAFSPNNALIYLLLLMVRLHVRLFDVCTAVWYWSLLTRGFTSINMNIHIATHELETVSV